MPSPWLSVGRSDVYPIVSRCPGLGCLVGPGFVCGAVSCDVVGLRGSVRLSARLSGFAVKVFARVVNSGNKELRRDLGSGVLSDLVGVFNR